MATEPKTADLKIATALLNRLGTGVDESGFTLLHFKARIGNLDENDIKRCPNHLNLRSQGCLIFSEYETPEVTPLLIAAFDGAPIDLLIKHKADVKIRDGRGRTAFHIATIKGRLGMLSQLLEAGAEINDPTAEGDTPLFLVLKEGSREGMLSVAMINFLIREGADVRARDAMGRSLCMVTFLRFNEQIPKAWAFFHTTRQIFLENLIKAGVDLNAQDNQGDTALHYAARIVDNELSILLEAGANPNIPNNLNQLPLALVDSQEKAETLVKFGSLIPESLPAGLDRQKLVEIRKSYLTRSLSRSLSKFKLAIEGSEESLLSQAEECRKTLLDLVYFSYIFFPSLLLRKENLIVNIINEYLFEKPSFENNLLLDEDYSMCGNPENIRFARNYYDRLLQFPLSNTPDITVICKNIEGFIEEKIFYNLLKRLKKNALAQNRENLSIQGPTPLAKEIATENYKRLVHAVLNDAITFKKDKSDGAVTAILYGYGYININKMLADEPDIGSFKFSQNDLNKCHEYFMKSEVFDLLREKLVGFDMEIPNLESQFGIKNNILHPAEQKALVYYCGVSFHAPINQFFRTNGAIRDRDYKTIFLLATVITQALVKLPAGEAFGESIRLEKIAMENKTEIAAQSRIGLLERNSIFYEKSLLSTHGFFFKNFKNSDLKGIEGSSRSTKIKNIIYIINNGNEGKCVAPYNPFTYEYEILFPIGTHFRLLDKFTDSNDRQFFVYEPVNGNLSQMISQTLLPGPKPSTMQIKEPTQSTTLQTSQN